MIIIAVVDDMNGLLFNHRRQSRDKVLCNKIITLTENRRLWMNHYSAKIFEEYRLQHLNIDDSFLSEAASGEFCFVENVAAAKYEQWVERIVLFKWNRKYPGDFFFDIDVHSTLWKLTKSEDFAGSSHDNITMEVYDHE